MSIDANKNLESWIWMEIKICPRIDFYSWAGKIYRQKDKNGNLGVFCDVWRHI